MDNTSRKCLKGMSAVGAERLLNGAVLLSRLEREEGVAVVMQGLSSPQTSAGNQSRGGRTHCSVARWNYPWGGGWGGIQCLHCWAGGGGGMAHQWAISCDAGREAGRQPGEAGPSS